MLTILTLTLMACARVITPAPGHLATDPADPAATVTAENTPVPPATVPTPTPIPTVKAEELSEEKPPARLVYEFPKTDFGRRAVPFSEILSGGPPKDGIPAIDQPRYVSIAEADDWLSDQEPVILLEVNGQVRAYPLQILTWHEIVNDALGGVPVAVTFCPLCNTAIAFEGRIDNTHLTFGTTGRLRYSNLVMYDRQTETWWQQATGEAIIGEHTGRRLTALPATIVGWETFKAAHPEGDVLSRDTGHSRSYGRNPYAGYDDVDRSPFLYVGPETPDRLLPMARVATVELNGEAVAYPYDVMERARVVNDSAGGTPLVVFWQPGTASALDSSVIAEGRDVGTVNTFARELDGRTLTFRFEDDRFLDEETGSEWTVLGQAVDGPLAGSQLEPVVHINHFWFSWAAFRPETRVYRLQEAGSNGSDPTPPPAAVGVDFDFASAQPCSSRPLPGS
jgi:hypothetical protein